MKGNSSLIGGYITPKTMNVEFSWTLFLVGWRQSKIHSSCAEDRLKQFSWFFEEARHPQSFR